MSNYKKAFSNLKKYDKEIEEQVLSIYNSVSETLIELIGNDKIKLSEATRKLNNVFNEAIESNDFTNKFRESTLSVIVESSFTSGLGGTKPEWGEYLFNKSLFDDKMKLSTRIRRNSQAIVNDQKAILFEALRDGRGIAKIVGNIEQDVLEGFTRSLPKYIDDLASAKINGVPLSNSSIQSVKSQISRLKTSGLRADYTRLIEAIELDKNIEKATYYAMERRTKYYAQRVARTETIAAMTASDVHIALKDEDTRLVRNSIEGSNPCPFCIAVTSLGFIPVESALQPPHHPHCSCKLQWKKTIVPQKTIPKDQFVKMLEKSVDEQNKVAQSAGKPKSYLDIVKPINLRQADKLADWDK
jgi:hypothetical protein